MIPVALMLDDSVLNIRPDFNKESVTVVQMSRVPNIGESLEIYANQNVYSQTEKFTVTRVTHWVLLQGDFRESEPKAEFTLAYQS
ncbi:hypothetical protein [Nostoc sp.]|uniref:Uncharacterized protein n=2 Tax=Nostoc TaxID=1177 RepID=A0A367RGI6_NOSPU|nr:hypothetical protein A6769_21255 [Nostoc punctiforme NIES-2108]